MATTNHYPPVIGNIRAGSIIIDHFGNLFMVVSLNRNEEVDIVIDLTDGCVCDNTDIACPWVIADRSEVQL